MVYGDQVIADMDPIRCRRLIKSKLLFAKQQNLRLDSTRLGDVSKEFQKSCQKLLSTHLKVPPEVREEEKEEMKESQATWERYKAGCF